MKRQEQKCTVKQSAAKIHFNNKTGKSALGGVQFISENFVRIKKFLSVLFGCSVQVKNVLTVVPRAELHTLKIFSIYP